MLFAFSAGRGGGLALFGLCVGLIVLLVGLQRASMGLRVTGREKGLVMGPHSWWTKVGGVRWWLRLGVEALGPASGS